MSANTIRKRRKLSSPLYLMLRKGRATRAGGGYSLRPAGRYGGVPRRRGSRRPDHDLHRTQAWLADRARAGVVRRAAVRRPAGRCAGAGAGPQRGAAPG
ncbi:UNVERIFIED_CONTAM: hypothetical protein NCL1_52068 [Trichonephila clavipes]